MRVTTKNVYCEILNLDCITLNPCQTFKEFWDDVIIPNQYSYLSQTFKLQNSEI